MIESANRKSEKGVALASALLIMTLLGVITLTIFAVVGSEARMAGSDIQRTNTFYCSEAAIEKMTTDFSALFTHTARPTDAQLAAMRNDPPSEIQADGYTFSEAYLDLDPDSSAERVTIPHGPFAGLIAAVKPYRMEETCTQNATQTQVKLRRDVNNYLIPIFQFGMFSNEDLEFHPGPQFTFNGRIHANGNIYLSGTVTLLSKVTSANEIVRAVLRNGQTHANTVSVKVGSINVPMTVGSVVASGSTVGGPSVSGAATGARGYNPGAPTGAFSTTWDQTSILPAASGTNDQFGGQVQTRSTGAVPLLLPLQLDGNPTREIIKRRTPYDSTLLSESRYHSKASVRILIDDESATSDASGIGTSQGVALSTWNPSVLGTDGRALWRVTDAGNYDETTSGSKSYPLQEQKGVAVQADTVRGSKLGPVLKTITAGTRSGSTSITYTTSANHGFANGDQVVVSSVGGLTGGNGTFTVSGVTSGSPTTFTVTGTGFGGTYTASTGTVYSWTAIPKSSNGTAIPGGAGITGRVLIQIVDTDRVTTHDVTQQILSMGITEGEPNSIITLQRPLWAAFVQGSKDSSGSSNTTNINLPPSRSAQVSYTNSLTDIMSKTSIGMDGQIQASPTVNSNGFLTGVVDDATGEPTRSDLTPAATSSPANLMTDWSTTAWTTNKDWNTIVPINTYNVREGLINSGLTSDAVYDRGITNVAEINMRNLARWLDGVYDTNLLNGTTAVSSSIVSPDGYTVYISDRRGDRVRSMTLFGSAATSSNGMVDNEDIYGTGGTPAGTLPNGILDGGEDVQATGSLVKDTAELPDPAVLTGTSTYTSGDIRRALAVASWTNPNNYFRRSVRVFNGENLQISGGTGKLSSTKGLTIATENMSYIWGNFNTTGINCQPSTGSTLNDTTQTCYYLGNDVPTSVVSDAFFPLSRTWFDALTSLYPGNVGTRDADRGNTPPAFSASVDTGETSVRTAIIAGNNISALAVTNSADAGNSSSGESRLNGAMHNFPRFLEDWGNNSQRWNFVGSLIPLYHSTQALGPYNASSQIYGAPVRNWAFDVAFQNPDKLPPGTPQFEYIEPTAFREIY